LPKKIAVGKATLSYIFQKNYRPGLTEVTFTRQELNQALIDLKLHYQNQAHIPYEAGKRFGMPKEILEAGFNTIINKKKFYIFAYVEKNIIEFPESQPIIYPIKINASLLKHIAPEGLAKADEQTVLSIINKHKILQHFLNVEIQHYVPHRRCYVSDIGQVEIDQIAWGIQNNEEVIIPIEAKGGREAMTRSQIKNCIHYANAKHPGVKLRPIGIKIFSSGDIAIVETDLDTNPMKFGRYRIV